MLRQFEVQGVFPLNESVAIGRSRDKLRALQLLAREGIGLPVTAFAQDPRRAEDVIKEVGGTPCVIKLLEGTQGRGVILAETAASAKSIIEAFSAANMNILVQEYIKEAGGNDIRVLVIGGKVVASMMRSGKMGEFRANLHRGGKAEAVVVSEDERRTAVRSAEVLGLNVAGVDLLRSNRGPVVVEVNSSPGIEGMEHASGSDVAGAMIEFLERHAQRGADQDTRVRGKGGLYARSSASFSQWRGNGLPSPSAAAGVGGGGAIRELPRIAHPKASFAITVPRLCSPHP